MGPQSIYGLIEGTDESYLQSNSEMPHYNCCVPGCTNSFRNASHLHFYRLPKDEFTSELFPGSTSDKEITAQSGLLDKLQPYDQVMADKGFNCTDELASVGAELIRPAFLVKDTQFSKEETNHNKIVASLRVHVERLMERSKKCAT